MCELRRAAAAPARPADSPGGGARAVDDDDDDELAAASAPRAPAGSLPWLLLEVLRRSGYEEWLRYENADGASRHTRWRNLRELANLAAEHDASGLLEFLDSVALVQDQDMLQRQTAEAGAGAGAAAAAVAARGGDVKLLTIHASKGSSSTRSSSSAARRTCCPALPRRRAATTARARPRARASTRSGGCSTSR